MGTETAVRKQWNHDESLDWSLLENSKHKGLQNWVKDLNAIYKEADVFHGHDSSAQSIKCLAVKGASKNCVCILRKSIISQQMILVICNLSKNKSKNISIGVPRGELWTQILSSDSLRYDGKENFSCSSFQAVSQETDDCNLSIYLDMPALSIIFFKNQ